MYHFNYEYLEKLIIESKETQKDLAKNIGLPEKFFSKLDRDGNNLTFSDLCRLASFFDIDVDELFIYGNKNEQKLKKEKGKYYFSKYYEYKEKYLTLNPPEPDSIYSSWVSDVHAKSSYINSPVHSYIDKKNEYKRILEIFETMENVLISVVSCINIEPQKKEEVLGDIITYLVYGMDIMRFKGNKRKIIKYADKACIELVNQLEFKKIM